MITETKRKVGRPRLGDCRIETVVPNKVMTLLKERQQQGQGYYTRIAARILCNWANRNSR
jgi:hypothetical protein